MFKIFPVLLFTSGALAATCYNNEGTYDSSAQVCNSTAAVSTCCNSGDYCMSNGICLGGGGNNLFALGGCTDQNWSSPCVKYCMGSESSGGANVFACPLVANQAVTYCCGPNATTCCDNGDGFQIDVGEIILRAGQSVLSDSGIPISSSTTSSSSSAATLVSSVTTTTPACAAATSALSSQNGTSPASISSQDKKHLAIGLGIGIPLVLIFITTTAFLGWELRRYNNTRPAGRQEGVSSVKRYDGAGVGSGNDLYKGELDARGQIHELGGRGDR